MSWSRTSTPWTKTAPSVTSYCRQISDTNVDFPEPVLPTMAVVVPGSAVNETSGSTARSAPGYRKVAPSSRTTPRIFEAGRTGLGGVVTAGVTDNTSVMRSAHTDARGNTIKVIVANNTAIRIWVK